ncbi:unnamed protein product [Rhizoctonia solani]|uniref:Uncharacterized protein n=1 Tax=Rhizoctonia solani TaxID=456999 RepID=A0A8H3CCX9_9AGAM|nr:unnamed protein product [Rhizoctonia solani]
MLSWSLSSTSCSSCLCLLCSRSGSPCYSTLPSCLLLTLLLCSSFWDSKLKLDKWHRLQRRVYGTGISSVKPCHVVLAIVKSNKRVIIS